MSVITPDQINRKDFKQARNAKQNNLAEIASIQRKIQEKHALYKTRIEIIKKLQEENDCTKEEINECVARIESINLVNAQIDDILLEGYALIEESLEAHTKRN